MPLIEHTFFFFQLKHNLKFLQENNSPLLQSVINHFRLFCQKPPKGFEKYFKPGGAPKKDPPPESSNGSKEGKREVPPISKPSMGQTSSTPGSSRPDQWSFGAFGGSR